MEKNKYTTFTVKKVWGKCKIVVITSTPDRVSMFSDRVAVVLVGPDARAVGHHVTDEVLLMH
jgi:hypothetical protein